MLRKTKFIVAAATLAIAATLGAAGFAGKKYFDENYVLLNAEDQAMLNFQVNMLLQRAYTEGKAETCGRGASTI